MVSSIFLKPNIFLISALDSKNWLNQKKVKAIKRLYIFGFDPFLRARAEIRKKKFVFFWKIEDAKISL